MAKFCLKKKSKRIPARLRYKIEKKVRAHNKKLKKEGKKNPQKSGKPKTINVPNACPFKDEILQQVEELKKKKEEEKLKRKALWKEERKKLKQLELENGSLQKVANDAEEKQKIHESFKPLIQDDQPILTKKDGSLKAYYREFKKVVEAADVVLEIVDARDPMGTRCRQVEEAVLQSDGKKRLVIVVNKADLIPRNVLDEWLKYLRGFFPTVPFKASTQTQSQNLGRKILGKRKHRGASEGIKVSSCVGAELLMSLLGNYCRNKGIKTAITVGVVGLPNVGKSSLINSLKRSRACNVGAVPGVTKSLQEIQLDSKIKLLDSPGLVFAANAGNESEAAIALRNAVKIEALEDPFIPASAILQRATKDQMMELYDIGNYETPQEFFSLKAKRQGKFKKGGVVDTEAAARGLIDDWNRGKIKYYTLPPEKLDTHISSSIVEEMAKEFDIDTCCNMEIDTLASLKESETSISFKVDTAPMAEAMDEDDRGVLNKDVVLSVSSAKKKKKSGSSQGMNSSSLVPLDNKKLQKLQAKKLRKENARRERETTSLACVLENVIL